MYVIVEQVIECVIEYNLKEKKFKVVCKNGKGGRRRWMMGDCCIGSQIKRIYPIPQAPQPNIILLGDFNIPAVIWDNPQVYNPSTELKLADVYSHTGIK